MRAIALALVLLLTVTGVAGCGDTTSATDPAPSPSSTTGLRATVLSADEGLGHQVAETVGTDRAAWLPGLRALVFVPPAGYSACAPTAQVLDDDPTHLHIALVPYQGKQMCAELAVVYPVSVTGLAKPPRQVTVDTLGGPVVADVEVIDGPATPPAAR
ncbi:hypothetical protein [Nocardioides acrostichi]|uniref:Lipoprotein n=1 Tax=Nocardioides acrostichi TaxID=2784339 RepID=A0A930V173_9ACTN|nr:hypothetical protein [Nocardioides acrostichi]MBF4162164.1 hypothetical protein [Nocardioides acrostichi]